MMINHHITRRGDDILLGIGMQVAVMDILTNEILLRECVKILNEPHLGDVSTLLGHFGIYPISLVLGYDNTMALVLDGPDFAPARSQCVQIFPDRNELESIFREILNNATPV